MKEYKVGDIFELDEEYSDRAEWCNQNGKMIVELDNEGTRMFQIQEVPKPSEEELLHREYQELDNWFRYYDKQVCQYQRAIRLNQMFDKDMNALDTLAVTNSKRLKEIKTKLGI